MTNRKPAVALIIGDGDSRYIDRIKKVSTKLNIKIYEIQKE
jgi:hypothetical protein